MLIEEGNLTKVVVGQDAATSMMLTRCCYVDDADSMLLPHTADREVRLVAACILVVVCLLLVVVACCGCWLWLVMES